MPLYQPLFVVVVLQLLKGRLQLLNGFECPDPEQVLLQYADEALGTTVAFRGSDKGW